MSLFDKFLTKFVESFKSKDSIIFNVLCNVFSMRIIGNKTHGDLAEIALTEYINQFVDGYTAKHTGKEKFRAKEYEEDISVTNKLTGETMPISIKAYGSGPLQLSTNKDGSMFKYLKSTVGKGKIVNQKKIQEILQYPSFSNIDQIYILPLIYKEKKEQSGKVKGGSLKIIIFNISKAYKSVKKIAYIVPGKRGRKHPIYAFFDVNNQYIFEIRYGGAEANALQRGMWTHTENARQFFKELLVGNYTINEPLIRLIAKILVSRKDLHEKILKSYFGS